MTTAKERHPLALAELVAEATVRMLQDSCERIEVAGSIRRRREDVGDVEILCIPRVGGVDLFGQPVEGDTALDRRCKDLLDQGFLEYRLNVDGERQYGPRNKYTVHTATGIGVDIFTTSCEQWGMALLVRTGPQSFCRAVMTQFQCLGLQGHAYGGVSRGERMLDCPDEQTVFDLLQWDYIPPELRGNAPEQRWGQVHHAVRERRRA